MFENIKPDTKESLDLMRLKLIAEDNGFEFREGTGIENLASAGGKAVIMFDAQRKTILIKGKNDTHTATISETFEKENIGHSTHAGGHVVEINYNDENLGRIDEILYLSQAATNAARQGGI
jgi:hypothetical protein